MYLERAKKNISNNLILIDCINKIEALYKDIKELDNIKVKLKLNYKEKITESNFNKIYSELQSSFSKNWKK